MEALAEVEHGSEGAYRRGCHCDVCKAAHTDAGRRYRRKRGIGPRVTRPPLERFWEKVEKTDSCWLWTAALSQDGYGLFRDGRSQSAHRWLYKQLVGEIPDGLQLDHLCRVRNCVNPAHLEPVTLAENARRGRLTHCKRGHELTPENTYVQRACKLCYQARKEEGAS